MDVTADPVDMPMQFAEYCERYYLDPDRDESHEKYIDYCIGYNLKDDVIHDY